MKVNEIADELETRYKYAEASECMLDAATMLRQQQAEIEALKPYKEKIEKMERRYDEHFKKALG